MERLKARKYPWKVQRLDHCICSLVGDGKTLALALNKIPVLYILAEVLCNLTTSQNMRLLWCGRKGRESESERTEEGKKRGREGEREREREVWTASELRVACVCDRVGVPW